jgi:phage gpG-like protein
VISFRISADEGDLVAIPLRLQTLQSQFADMRPYWPEAIAEIYQIEKEQFWSEGNDGASGDWAPLDPAYAKRKEKKYPGAKIMERSGRLRRSLTQSGSDQTITSSPTSVTLTSEVPYGGFHQKGIGQKRRPPWSPTQRDSGRIMSVLTRAIRREVLAKFKVAA